jgi:hypothetical protein
MRTDELMETFLQSQSSPQVATQMNNRGPTSRGNATSTQGLGEDITFDLSFSDPNLQTPTFVQTPQRRPHLNAARGVDATSPASG